MYPRTPFAFNNLARLLATAPEAKIRNAKRAINLSQHAVSIHPGHANYLDTLAAAYAEAGHFQRAVEIEKHAYELEPKELYAKLIAAYRQRKTYVQFTAENSANESSNRNSERP